MREASPLLLSSLSSSPFLRKFLFFDPPLVAFDDVWWVLSLWNLVGFGVVFLGCGLIAGLVFRRHRFAVLIPVAASLAGSVAGFASGILLSLLVALLYRTGPFAMRWYAGVVFGLGLPVLYTIHSIVKFIV
jgi:hypothetical protein